MHLYGVYRHTGQWEVLSPRFTLQLLVLQFSSVHYLCCQRLEPSALLLFAWTLTQRANEGEVRPGSETTLFCSTLVVRGCDGLRVRVRVRVRVRQRKRRVIDSHAVQLLVVWS